MLDEIPNELTQSLQAPKTFDMSGTVDNARAWAALNNAAQAGGLFGPGVPVMPTFEEQEPRWEQYNPGVNLNILPRAGWGLMSFQQLRNIAAACKEIRLNIELIKRTIRGFSWEIAPVKDKKGFSAGELDTFFQKPDGVHDLKGWIEIILEDLLVLDAVTIWPRLEGSRMVAADVISSDTIRINIDFRGRPAFPPAPAYFQVLWGVPRLWTTSDRIIYSMMHPRAQVPYGKSAIEDVIASINVSIRRELQRIGYYTEGNVPHSFVGLPSNWSVDQIKEYQLYIDALIMGNESRANRFIFIPHDGSNIPVAPFTTTNLDGVTLDEYLMKIACWAYGNSPAEFGLTGGSGLGGKGFMGGMEDIQYRSSINPVVQYIQDLVTYIIQVWLKRPDAKFTVVGNKPIADQLQQAQIDQVKMDSGIYTAEFVQDRDGVDQKYRPAPEAAQPTPTTESTPNTPNEREQPAPVNETFMRAALRGLKVDLNNWQDTALRFMEKGWVLKPNTSTTIPPKLKAQIEAGLKDVKQPEDIRAVFDMAFAKIKSDDVHDVFEMRKALTAPHSMDGRRDRLHEAWHKSQKRIAAEILPVMQRQKKRIELMLKGNVKKADAPPQQSTADQEKYKREFLAALLLALGLAASDLGDIENDVWSSHDYPRLTFNASKLIADYQERLGRELSEIAQNALNGIQKEVNAWYGTDEPIDDLIARLDNYLGPLKADTIGSQEVGNLLSQMTLEVMDQYGFDEWTWRHRGGDVPCANPITVAGVTYNGCIDLDGRKFKRGDAMPPDAAHVGCHCLPQPVLPS